MQVTSIKTVRVTSRSISLTTLLDTYLNQFEEKQILAITSKIVALCEGAECTPLAVISDIDFVDFQSRNPSEQELQQLRIPMKDDLFAPFLEAVPWKKGGQAK